MRALACLVLIFATAVYAQEHRYTKTELMASVDDATAAELRWLFEASEVWTLSGGIMGPTPRDRTAWARLICHGDIELLTRIARCENPTVAVYGLLALKFLASDKLVDLLPWLVENPETADGVAGDIGFTASFLEFAAEALRQLSPRADKQLLHDVTGQWLDRLAKGHVTDWDWDFGRVLADRVTPRGMRALEYTEPSRKELLELAPWLIGGYYGPGLNAEKADQLRDRPLLRRTLLMFDCEVYIDSKEEKFVRLACDELDADPEAEINPDIEWLVLQLAHGLHAMIVGGVPLRDMLQITDYLRDTPAAGRKALVERYHEEDRDIVRQLLMHPLIDWKPEAVAPDDPAMHQVWHARVNEQFDEDEDMRWMDDDYAAHPERLFWREPEWMPIHTWNWNRLLPGPMPDGSIPRHWQVFAKSADERHHLAMLYSLTHSALDDIQKLVDAKDGPALRLKAAIDAFAQGSNVRVKWLARDVLFTWARDNQGDDAAMELALGWVKELASDLMANPRVAFHPNEMMQALEAKEWEGADAAGGEDGTATPEEVEAARSAREAWYNLAMLLSEVGTDFQDREDLAALALEELRKIEFTPQAAWENYADLRRKAAEKE